MPRNYINCDSIRTKGLFQATGNRWAEREAEKDPFDRASSRQLEVLCVSYENPFLNLDLPAVHWTCISFTSFLIKVGVAGKFQLGPEVMCVGEGESVVDGMVVK